MTTGIPPLSARGPYVYVVSHVVRAVASDAIAEHLDSLWQLYCMAYDPLASALPTREHLSRSEFDRLLRDHECTSFVAWIDDVPVGLCPVTRGMQATRYVSERFFDVRYPEQKANQKLYYLVFLVVHPGHTQRRVVNSLADLIIPRMIEEDATLVFDSYRLRQKTNERGFAAMMQRLARSAGSDAIVKPVVQRSLFAIDMAELNPQDDRVDEVAR